VRTAVKNARKLTAVKFAKTLSRWARELDGMNRAGRATYASAADLMRFV
jgi:hypothetical protein